VTPTFVGVLVFRHKYFTKRIRDIGLLWVLGLCKYFFTSLSNGKMIVSDELQMKWSDAVPPHCLLDSLGGNIQMH
jgi:hypothetical protein